MQTIVLKEKWDCYKDSPIFVIMKNIRMIYVIRCGRDYICKGSYVVQGAKYKVIGGIEEARKFKTEDAAQREAKRLNNSYKYENISDDCAVVKIE